MCWQPHSFITTLFSICVRSPFSLCLLFCLVVSVARRHKDSGGDADASQWYVVAAHRFASRAHLAALLRLCNLCRAHVAQLHGAQPLLLCLAAESGVHEAASGGRVLMLEVAMRE